MCEREKIFNYLSDLLDEKEEKIIEEHLINCPLCQKYEKEFQLIKEEIIKKETPPSFSYFYEKLVERIKKRKRKNFVLVSALASFLILLFFFSLLFLKERITKIEEYVLEENENYETIIDNLSPNEEIEILKELSKEIKEEDLILLEEKLEEEKDYYDLIFDLDKKELEYVIKNLNKGG